MSEGIRFGDLKIGDEFTVWGDEFINYDFPKSCDCIKVDDQTGQEIGGCRFLMSPDDRVGLPNKK